MCGEKFIDFFLVLLIVGSPPHVRGKERPSTLQSTEQRITPACAGKRYALKEVAASEKDHPRMCGEKKLSIICTLSQKGSPPHVRGKG